MGCLPSFPRGPQGGTFHQGLVCKNASRNVQGGPGSVRFGYGSGVERFGRFQFSVPAVPLQKSFFFVSVQFNRKGRFRFRFRFLENGSGSSGTEEEAKIQDPKNPGNGKPRNPH